MTSSTAFPARFWPLLLFAPVAALVLTAVHHSSLMPETFSAGAAMPADPASTPKEKYGHLPLRFDENAGQSDARVKYLAHGRDHSLFVTAEGITWSLRGETRNFVVRRDEPDETVNLTLSTATGGAALGTQTSAALTVADDDPTPTTPPVTPPASPPASSGGGGGAMDWIALLVLLAIGGGIAWTRSVRARRAALLRQASVHRYERS